MYICRIVIHFLIWLFYHCLVVSTYDVLLLMSNKDGDFCLTNSSSAMYYRTTTGEVKTEATSFNNSNFLCHFETSENQKNCLNNIQGSAWSLTFAFDTPILDMRWEHFPVIKLLPERSEAHYEYIRQPERILNSRLSLSLLGSEVGLFLSDQADTNKAKWYSIKLDGNKISFEKCIPETTFSSCNTITSDVSDHLRMSKKIWTHIIIERNGTKLCLKTYEEVEIHCFADNDMFELNYFFAHSQNSNAYYKLHRNHFMQSSYTSQANFSNQFETRSKKVCISIFLKTCPICSTSVQFINERSKILSRNAVESTNDNWSKHDIVLKDVDSKTIRVQLTTILNGKPRGKEYWAFDNLRSCYEGEYRILEGSSNKISECRLVTNKKLVKNEEARNDVVMRPSPIYWRRCNIFKSFRRHCDNMKICENIDDNNICRCSAGYTGSECDKACEMGRYGNFCQLKCGYCKTEGICNNINGSCECNSLFRGDTCHIPKEGNYLKDGPVIENIGLDFCEIDWGGADFAGKKEPKYYLIQYSDDEINTWTDYGKVNEIEEYKKARIEHLYPNKTYKIRVLVSHGKFGVRHLVHQNLPYTRCKTREPELPYNINVVWTPDNYMEIFWNYPEWNINNLKYFQIEIPYNITLIYSYQTKCMNTNCSYSVSNPFLPAVDLNITISAVKIDESNKSASIIESSFPPKPNLSNFKMFIKNYTATTLTLSFNLTDIINDSKSLDHYMFILIDDLPINQEDENLIHLEKTMNKTFDATSRLRIVTELNFKQSIITKIVNFTIGDNQNGDITENSILKAEIGNKPLQEGQNYNITIIILNGYKGKYRYNLLTVPAWTSSGLRSEMMKDNDTSGFPIYAILLILLIIPIIWIIMRRKKIALAIADIPLAIPMFWKALDTSINFSTSSTPPLPLRENSGTSHLDVDESDVAIINPLMKAEEKSSIRSSSNISDVTYSKLVRIVDFREYVKTSTDGDELERQHALFPKGPTRSLNYGTAQMNKHKNRYNNLAAYDHSRVILEKIDGDEYSDYINANYIHVLNIERAYIATQGPKSTTINDFWRMVWQENVEHIVMLANLYEGGKKRVDQYWPNINEELTFHNIVVSYKASASFAHYEQRVFNVKRGNEMREVEQLHFISWPDHGIPVYPQNLVAFLRRILKIPLSSESPIVIHCSAGIGRTGTILLTDISLRRAAKQGVVDMLDTLHNLRKQRQNMVDNATQYKLAHLLVLECLMGLQTSIPCDESMIGVVHKLIKSEDYKLQMNYLKETEWQDAVMQSIAVVNSSFPNYPEKNRFEDIIPGKIGRVSLNRYPLDDESSSYINAVNVDGFRCPNRFLVTQQPMPNTLGDFWRLVAEKQIKVVLSLNEVDLEEKTCCKFWPTSNDPEIRPADYLVVQFDEVTEFKSFDAYSVHLWIKNDNETTKLDVVIVSFRKWPHKSMKPLNCDEFLSFYEEAEAISRSSTNVIVTCFDGVTASGVYVALSFMVEQMKLEKHCDVCFSVRTIRHNRKQFVNNEDQYLFLFDCAVNFIHRMNLKNIQHQ